MAKVWIPALLRPLCDDHAHMEVAATTLKELFLALDVECPGIYDRIVENGRIRPELAIAINGEAESFPLFEPIGPNADIAIVPAIGGGAENPPNLAPR